MNILAYICAFHYMIIFVLLMIYPFISGDMAAIDKVRVLVVGDSGWYSSDRNQILILQSHKKALSYEYSS